MSIHLNDKLQNLKTKNKLNIDRISIQSELCRSHCAYTKNVFVKLTIKGKSVLTDFPLCCHMIMGL